ncbi:MAG: DNA sulfur modification protein DndD [Fusobacteriaceae bacterium]
MLIKNIVLNNFGIFYGLNKLNLDTTKEKNIVLIGGKNGSGKTTVLNAIKLCLYGSQILEARTISNYYVEYIKELFNHRALEEKLNDFYVELELELEKESIVEVYKIRRGWQLKNNKIEENIYVSRGKEILNKNDIDNLENYFRTYIPKELFDFFFFDGEKIKELTKNSELGTKLEKEILTLFNLDLFDSLSDDIKKYLKIKNEKKELEIEEKRIFDIKEEISFETKNEIVLNQEIKEKEAKNNYLREQIGVLKVEFLEKGGLLFQDIEKEKVREATLVEKLSILNKEIVNFSAELLPFIILQDEVLEIKDELKSSENKRAYEILVNHLNIDSIKNSFELSNSIEASSIIKKIEGYYKEIFKITESTSYLSIISEMELEILNKIFDIVEDFKVSFIDKKYLEINEVKNIITSIKTKISINENDESIKLITGKIEKIEKESILIEAEIKLKKEEQKKKQKIILEKSSKLEELTGELNKKNIKGNNKFIISNKIMNILNKYIEIRKKDKISIIEYHFEEIFKKMHRKEDFIKKIKIEDETLHIKLYDKNNNNIPLNKLSEGEKEIYILSLLYSLIKASKREVPLVMDTLLGRLDSNHRASILNEFLPDVGKQIIILSTDSEIDQNYYNMIKNKISSEYEMVFEPSDNNVTIKNKYFFTN